MTYINIGIPENNQEKTLLCFVLDSSGAMAGEPIHKLNKAIAKFYSDVKEDCQLMGGHEIAIIDFSSTVELKKYPSLLEKDEKPPLLIARGCASLNTAVREATQLVEERKDYYKNNCISYCQPWIILITSGASKDGDVADLANQIELDTKDKKYVFLPIGIGSADMSAISQMAGYIQQYDGRWIQVKPQPMRKIALSDILEYLMEKRASMACMESSDIDIPKIHFNDFIKF